MASTNKTTHYDLSQYVGSDKPTFLGDYNTDMSKIDTAINSAQTTADSASTAATNAQTTAETAQTTANTAVTNAAAAQAGVVENSTNIGTLANLTTVEKTSVVGAINEVNGKTEVVDSMAGTETNKAPSVDSLKTYLKGTVLYNNAQGTAGNITLSETVANFDEIEIFFNRGDMGHTSMRIDTSSADLTNIGLTTTYFSGNIWRLYARCISISGTSLSNVTTDSLSVNFYTNPSVVDVGYSDTYFKITKIIGYKY